MESVEFACSPCVYGFSPGTWDSCTWDELATRIWKCESECKLLLVFEMKKSFFLCIIRLIPKHCLALENIFIWGCMHTVGLDADILPKSICILAKPFGNFLRGDRGWICTTWCKWPNSVLLLWCCAYQNCNTKIAAWEKKHRNKV